jgi:hypothetical protein
MLQLPWLCTAAACPLADRPTPLRAPTHFPRAQAHRWRLVAAALQQPTRAQQQQQQQQQ